MTTRKYSSRAQQTTLSSSITDIATTMTVGSGANLMGGKTPAAGETYTVVIDPDTALEEIVDVSNYSSGNTLTITRGRDGSTGVAHSAGAVIRHMVIGRDLQEANDHIENTTTAHGITLANIVQTGTTGTVSSGMIADGAIVNADINASAAIVDTKLATISTASKVSNSATTATSANTASAIVARDASGNFTAGTITGNLTGNVTGNVTGNLTGTASAATLAATATALATGRTISLTGDVTGTSASFDGTGNASITAAIGANTIVDADINASAAIDKTKISGTAVTVADTGTVTSTMIADGTIVNADINASAAIDWTKLGVSSTVSSTEIGYVDGVTSAIQTQIDSKLATTTAASTYAPLASPTLTGVPLAPTAAANTNTTQIATTAYVQTELTDLIGGAPGALDTLNELATALANDASYSTTITTALATKLPLAGGTMSGAIAMGTNKITGLGTPTTNTDAATKAYADTMLPLAGGTMSGVIAMGNNKITGLATPTVSTDAATKGYIDTASIAPSNLTGPITSVGPATSVAAQTGTGSTFVMNTSPTLVTPVLGVATATSINGTTIPSSKTLVATDSTQYVVPSQTSNSGKYLTTDGTTSSWGVVDALPSQTGNSGKFLTTNGTAASWSVITTDPTPTVFMLMGA